MEISKFFVGRGRKGQAVFSPFVLLCGTEGCRAKLERKNSPFGPAQRIREGRIGVEGLCDFRL